MGDVHQLIHVVVGEVDVVADAGAETRDVVEEPVHLILVAGHDHHQVVAVVLHDLEQHLHRLLAVVPLVVDLVDVVRLVDEEDPAPGLLQHLLGLGRGVAHASPGRARDPPRRSCSTSWGSRRAR